MHVDDALREIAEKKVSECLMEAALYLGVLALLAGDDREEVQHLWAEADNYAANAFPDKDPTGVRDAMRAAAVRRLETARGTLTARPGGSGRVAPDSPDSAA